MKNDSNNTKIDDKSTVYEIFDLYFFASVVAFAVGLLFIIFLLFGG